MGGLILDLWLADPDFLENLGQNLPNPLVKSGYLDYPSRNPDRDPDSLFIGQASSARQQHQAAWGRGGRHSERNRGQLQHLRALLRRTRFRRAHFRTSTHRGRTRLDD